MHHATLTNELLFLGQPHILVWANFLFGDVPLWNTMWWDHMWTHVTSLCVALWCDPA